MFQRLAITRPLQSLLVMFAFGRHLVNSVTSTRSLQVASALAYTTLLSLVPLVAVTLGFLGMLPYFSQFEGVIRDFAFENFVPAVGTTIEDYISQFAGQASQLTLLGMVSLVAIALMLMATIENSFNAIWRISNRRRPLRRILVYVFLLTFGPLLIGAGIAATSYLLTDSSADGITVDLGRSVLSMLPFLLTAVALVLLYVLVPNCQVSIRHAMIGAITAAVLFETAKSVFAWYVSTVPTYEAMYGALAVVPIFLIWIYVSWIIVLLGAQLTYSLGSFVSPMNEVRTDT